MPGRLVSIDIGSKNIHLVTGRHKGETLEVEQAFTVPTPESAIKDGRIDDIHSLKSVIKDVFAKNKIKTKRVVFTIQSTSIITRDLSLPSVKQDELNTMVKYEIEQYLPIVASEYVIEYTFLEEFEEDNVQKSKLRVAAMPQIMVDNYFNLVKEVGLKPVALDIHTNTVAKLFSNSMMAAQSGYSMGKTYALIDFGFQNITVHILSKGRIDFSRIITLGGKDIDTDVSVSYSLTLDKAEEKKIKEGHLEQRGHEELPEEMFNDILRAKVDTWIQEIQKIFQYYISRNTGNRIDTIYIYGGTAKIKGLSTYLEQAINIKVKKIDDLSCVKAGGELPMFNPDSYINALGGLIRYE